MCITIREEIERAINKEWFRVYADTILEDMLIRQFILDAIKKSEEPEREKERAYARRRYIAERLGWLMPGEKAGEHYYRIIVED